ncbi:MAG TPA: hypothetical protein VGK94_07395 [Candidatus Polarisedimenticolia bacterium]|jgi:hypothetical protein
MFRRHLVLTIVLLCVWAPAAGSTRRAGGWPPGASAVRDPDEVRLPQAPQAQEALRQGHPGVRRFLGDHPGWRGTVDPFTGSLDRAFGEGLELGSADDPEAAARSFVARHRSLFAPGIEEAGSALDFDEAGSRPLLEDSGPGGVRVLRFDLVKDGLPVLGAGLSLGVRDDSVILIVSRTLGPVAVSSKPKLDPARALASLTRYLEEAGTEAGGLTMPREPALAFYPRLESLGPAQVLRHHLVWVLEVRPEGTDVWESYIAWVDARDGEVLAFFPEARNIGACSPDPRRARATVLGGVRPNRADDVERIVQFPFARAEVGGSQADADINGRFPYAGGAASSTLGGRFFRMHCDNCSFPAQPSGTGDPSGDIDFGTGGGSAGPPVLGNGYSTPADRTTYFHANLLRLLLGKWDNAFFEEIEAHVNIQAVCNAFSSGHIVAFYNAGGTCRNTGEIRDVIYHELGHTWDRFDGTGITNGALSEWKGDLMALSLAGDTCVGESFSTTSLKTTNCSGVRDIDEKAPGRTDHPLTPAVCSTCATLTRTANNCGTSTHCLGEITGQATWHLLQNLLAGADYITGAALPAGNPALPAERARWIFERILIAGGPPMETWDPVAAGVSTYDAMMLIDDDDANLSNGTPHAAYINAAWSHHGIAETPLVIDSGDCAALSDPIVTLSLASDPATGLPAVTIDWTPVGGATSFDVLRNTRAGDAFLPLARNVGAGPILDVGVQAGATYRYLVSAVRRTGCADVSPGSNVVTVTVGLPEVKVGSFTAVEVAGGSDSDGLLEPGERVAVGVRLGETAGSAPATGVTATLTSGSASSPVISGGPLSYGTIPAGGNVAPPADFEIFIGPSEACAGKVHVAVAASGNEGCWLDSFDIVLDGSPSCAVTPTAFVEVVPGSVSVASPGGDADGVADNCEAVTVNYLIRNSGSLASGPAGGDVTTSHPRVTFAPDPPTCSVASLAGGASAPCQFRFSLGGATASGVPFTLTTDSAGNPAPSSLDVTLGAETNPPVFGTMGYGFEGSLQGWTGVNFGLSSAHASSGIQSAHAGSTMTSNICAKLISPALLLDPAGASTMSFNLFAMIEPLSDAWYDRANVHIIDLDTGQHTLVSPSSGVAYNASGNPAVEICHVLDQAGWGGLLGGFTLETFDLSAFNGRRIQVEINYDTDEGDDREGIYVDEVTITNAAAAALPADLQSDLCVVPEVSSDLASVPLDVLDLGGGSLRFAWGDLGAGYQYNLYAGSLGSYYSHGAGALSCGEVGNGVACDGTSCALDLSGGALPAASSYFLATATAFGLEGTSGFTSAGLERPPAQSTCAP